MQPKQFTSEELCQTSVNLIRNPTPEAKEEYKQAERERHRQIYKENTVAEKQRTKLWGSEEIECNVKLKRASLNGHLKSKKHMCKIENTQI